MLNNPPITERANNRLTSRKRSNLNGDVACRYSRALARFKPSKLPATSLRIRVPQTMMVGIRPTCLKIDRLALKNIKKVSDKSYSRRRSLYCCSSICKFPFVVYTVSH